MGNGVGDEGWPEGLRLQAHAVSHELAGVGEHPGWQVLEPDWWRAGAQASHVDWELCGDGGGVSAEACDGSVEGPQGTDEAGSSDQCS